jgi:hypothetical protein
MNKIVFAGLAAAVVGTFLAPASNAFETIRTSSYTVSSPVIIEHAVSTPVLIEREMTAPVIIDRTYSLPTLIDRPVSMPVLVDDRDHLVEFDSPVLRFGLF